MRLLALMVTLAAAQFAGCQTNGPGMGMKTLQACDGRPPLTINLNRNGPPTAAPPNCTIVSNTTLVIQIAPPPSTVDTVLTVAKKSNKDGGGKNNWLSGSNSSDRMKIEINVPEKQYFIDSGCGVDENGDLTDCEFEYAIVDLENVQFYDPKVTVRK